MDNLEYLSYINDLEDEEDFIPRETDDENESTDDSEIGVDYLDQRSLR